jgi:hypothetical protein
VSSPDRRDDRGRVVRDQAEGGRASYQTRVSRSRRIAEGGRERNSPPVADSRLYRLENGDVGYMLKTGWSDGTFAVRFSPMEFIERLVALVPPPRIHLTRYHGVLAPNHSWRSQVVPGNGNAVNSEGRVLRRRWMSWAEVLKRVFKIDLTICPDCGGKVKFVAAVMKREVVVRILSHLNLPTTLPCWIPARSPPSPGFEF